MMLTLKKVVIFLLISLGGASSFAAKADKTLLLEAMKKSEVASYIATAKLDDGKDVTITRHADPDGNVFKKLQYLDNSGFMLQNNDGVFASSGDKTTRILWNSSLFMWDDLFREIHPDELKLLDFSAENTTYADRDCIKITVTIPSANIEKLKLIGGFVWPKYKAVNRAFTIDRESKIILRREHFDTNGKLISDIGFIKIQLNPEIPEAEFSTPRHVEDKLFTTLANAQTNVAKKDLKNRTESSMSGRIIQNIKRTWIFLSVTVAIFLLVLAATFMRKKTDRKL